MANLLNYKIWQHCMGENKHSRKTCNYYIRKSENDTECIYFGKYFDRRCDYSPTSFEQLKKTRGVVKTETPQVDEELLIEAQETNCGF